MYLQNMVPFINMHVAFNYARGMTVFSHVYGGNFKQVLPHNVPEPIKKIVNVWVVDVYNITY